MNIIYPFIILCITIGCKQIQTEKSIHTESTSTENDWYFWTVDMHPTKDQFVLGGSNDSYLKIISCNDLTELKSITYLGTITNTKWHPNKERLAIAVQDGKSTSLIMDLENNKLFELDSLPDTGVRAIGWNNDGNILAVGDNEGYLTFYDDQGKYLQSIDTDQKGIISLDWHPKKNLLAAVGEKITLYNLDKETFTNIKHRQEEVLMLSVAWHPSGTFFVTGDYGDFNYNYSPYLQYWTSDGTNIRTIDSSKAEIRNLCWSTDGELLATASEKIRLWNKSGEYIAAVASEHLLWGISWNKDSSLIVTTDENKEVTLWDRSLNTVGKLQY